MASGKPTAIHFTLVFFVMATIIAAVMAYIQFNDLQENMAKFKQTENELNTANDTIRKLDDQIQALKRAIGHNFESVGVGDEQNPSTVLGAVARDVRELGGSPTEGTYVAALRSLRTQLDTALRERNAKDNDLKAEHQTLLAVQGTADNRVRQHEDARREAETQLQGLITEKDELVSQKQQEVTQLRTDVSQLKIEIEQTKEASARALKEKSQEIVNLELINDRLREKLDEATQQSFEQPDGEIRVVDNSNGLVWINLGERDSLPKRTTFSVYTKAHHGVGRGEEDIKASIEVTRILGPHLAEARILGDDIFEPIAPGDPIYTPLWSTGRVQRFSFVGTIDMDGDGVSDRELLHDIVASAGATIDNEVDDEGNRTGNAIDVYTKFLVIGELPDPGTAPTAAEQRRMEQILEHHTAMRKEARQQGVRVVNLTDFLAFIGYKPQRRLWVPGTDVPWMLKNGSQSVGVNAYVGERKSSGQVSGLYSRSKDKLQDRTRKSTGQLFRGGAATSGSGY